VCVSSWKELISLRHYFFFLILIVMPMGASSLLTTEFTIKSSGVINYNQSPTNQLCRGVFISKWYPEDASYQTVDLNLIVQTIADYGVINALFIQVDDTRMMDDAPIPAEKLKSVISLAHSKGIKVFAVTVLTFTRDPASRAVDYLGYTTDFACPCNPNALNRAKTVIQKIAGYDFDGIQLDFIRWAESIRTVDAGTGKKIPANYICYCQYCKSAFEQFIGYSISDYAWTHDYAPGGSQDWRKQEWWHIPITNLLRNTATWAREIKPNMPVSVAVFEPYIGTASGAQGADTWKWWIGQDTVGWVKNGYISAYSPMIYTNNIYEFTQKVNKSYTWYNPERKVPNIPYVGIGNVRQVFIDVNTFIEELKILKQYKTDGFIIFEYGGPEGVPSVTDIRPYLQALKESGVLENWDHLKKD